MNERDFTLIDDYFNGILPPETAQQVEARAASETDFGAEFDLRRDMEAYPRRAAARAAFQTQLAEIGQSYFAENAAQPTESQPLAVKRVNLQRWLALAAVFLLLIVAVWFIAQPKTSLYAQYADHAPLSLTVRGAADNWAETAQKTFNAGNYQAALTALNHIVTEQPDNTTAQLYRAICMTELGAASDARAVLAPIATGNSALRGEAVWLTALSHLKENNTAECRRILQNISSDEPRFEAAQALLKKLPQ
jgi:anti-sigma-K factor RskA